MFSLETGIGNYPPKGWFPYPGATKFLWNCDPLRACLTRGTQALAPTKRFRNRHQKDAELVFGADDLLIVKFPNSDFEGSWQTLLCSFRVSLLDQRGGEAPDAFIRPNGWFRLGKLRYLNPWLVWKVHGNSLTTKTPNQN